MKFKRRLNESKILLAAITLLILLVAWIANPNVRLATANELMVLMLLPIKINLYVMRAIVIGLLLVNTLVTNRLLRHWFGRRRAAVSTVLLLCLPLWVTIQISFPRVSALLATLIISLFAFDTATRSKSPSKWYALSGLSLGLAWLQDPIASMLVAVAGLVLLIIVKPRYIKHIARQASLIPIVASMVVVAVVAASWKLDWGIQDYLVRELRGNHLHIPNLQLLTSGPTGYHFGLPGVSLLPLGMLALALFGIWQLLVQHKRPRNLFISIASILTLVGATVFNGYTGLVLLLISLVFMAILAMCGSEYLHRSWQRIFPLNKLARSTGRFLLAIMVFSLAFYSLWYVNKAWWGNPQTRHDAEIEWSGTL